MSLLKSFLPTTRKEMEQRGWDALDVLLISGDAYVDHPSFGVAVLGRVMERQGLRVGILPQPRFDTTEDFLEMGRPRLFVGISAGAVDSMLNNYTANRKKRSDDMYSEGGEAGHRPDYASVVYARLARQAFPETPIIVGGVEASLRRLAHYDYWQNRVRPSILMELEANFIVYGMGERPIRRFVELLRTLSKEEAIDEMKKERGIAYLTTRDFARTLDPRLTLPSFEEVRDNKKKFAKATYLTELESNPYGEKYLIQPHGSRAVVVNPATLPLSTEELDEIYALPYTKDPHPRYKKKIPAAEMIRFSITASRGCFGGCSFCAITLHQGRVVQSRSQQSVLDEISRLKNLNDFTGCVSDVGGPTANMYGLHCKSLEIQKGCRKFSCLFPKACPHLNSDHSAQRELLEKARHLPGVNRVLIASGVRYDLAMQDPVAGEAYLRDLITHHVGGRLKVAPEHLDSEVLELMKKPPFELFEKFSEFFDHVSYEVGKKQFLVPYFISGFPGCTHEKMECIHDYLQKKHLKLQQVQAFIPTPMTLATAMYWTGLDPMSGKPLFVAKEWKDRKLQQALLQPQKRRHTGIIKKK